MNKALLKHLFNLFLVLAAFNLQAGEVEKALDALKEYDYFKAKKLFEKRIEKEIVASSYGLSVIYGRNDNPFYNLDSAYKYITTVDTSFLKLSKKDKEKLGKYGLDSLMFQNWKDSIDLKVFKVARVDNTVEVYEAYIKRHPDSEWLTKAENTRDSIILEGVMKVNTSEAYYDFLQKYPNSKYQILAKDRYEVTKFNETVKKNREQHYKRFIDENPDSPFFRRAQDSLFAISTASNTQEAYASFIKKYPANPHLNTAWRRLYKLYTAEYSPERIVEFRLDYPGYPFMKELDVYQDLASKQFYRFKKDGKWGFMDENGSVRISPIYDNVEPFSEGLALVVVNKKVGFIDQAGREVIPKAYDDGESFVGGLAIVSINDQYGMIDRINRVVIPLKFDVVSKFYKGLALVADENGYGFIDKKGEMVIETYLDFASDFKNGFSIVEKSGVKGIIDDVGEFIIPIKYKWLTTFSNESLFVAKDDFFFGVLNEKGEIVVPFIYDRIGEYHCGLALAVRGDKYGFLNTKGEIAIPLKYQYSEGAMIWGNFTNFYAKYNRKGKFGVVDTSGKEIFPAIFEGIDAYVPDVLIGVKKRGKWGYSNQKLKLTIPYKYDYAFSFKNDVAIVKKQELFGMVNEDGKEILSVEYKHLETLNDSLYTVGAEKLGLTNKLGHELLPFNFSEIKISDYESLIELTEGDNVFYYNLQTNALFKPN